MRFSRRLYAGAFLLTLSLALPPMPAAGADHYVAAGGDLQAAINAAGAGDTILLEPGATFVGNFKLRVHGGTTYVTIRSAARDDVLPRDGMRITPGHSAHLPKIKSPNTGPAIATVPGAAYWRLMFLELDATVRGYYDILALGDGSAEGQNALSQVPHHLVVDRVYIHGDRLHGQKRGIAINSGTTTIANSYISDIKAIGQDSQAIGGWNGPGPYTIENNYLEAAGEVFMLGGSAPGIRNLVPSDVTLRRNTLTRPLSWRNPIVAAPAGVRASSSGGGGLASGRYGYRVVAHRPAYDTVATSAASTEVTVTVGGGSRITIAWDPVPDATEYRVYGRTAGAQSGYWTVASTTFTDGGGGIPTTGTPPQPTVWQVKNLLELKNARRVRIERNLMQNNWAQAQIGTAVLFTPRAEGGACTWCVVEDVAFEYNIVDGVGGGVNILGIDDYTPSQQTNNIRIRHNIFCDVSKSWGGDGYFMYVLGKPRNVIVDHNTIISPNGAGVIMVEGPPVFGFVFTNNVARHNSYGIIGAGHAPGLHTITNFFPDAIVTRNVLAGGDPKVYPAQNEFPTVPDFEAHFLDYPQENFALKPATDWERAGTDGLDLGAELQIRPAAPTGVRVVP